jgi:lysine-N-methylase
MTLPVRHLPVLQNWDCHGCTDCCRTYQVHISDEERQRIEAQGWSKLPEYQGIDVIVREGSRRRPRYRLGHHKDGTCVFLGDGGRCKIHEKFGGPAKPLTCRVYPYMLVPAGDHWRIGIRFACPSAANNLGRPLTEQTKDIRELAAEYQKQEFVGGRTLRPPPLHGRQTVPWEDLFLFAQALGAIMQRRSERVERRLRKWLALASLCREAQFEKVTGPRLEEFLGIVLGALEDEVPEDAARIPPPSWAGRLLFRQILVLFTRKDIGPQKGRASRSRRALFSAAVRFARGTGPVPPVNSLLPETTFEALEAPAGLAPAECEEILERYFLMKVHSLQFTGPTNFHMSFWDGIEALVLTYPITMWLARAFSAQPRKEALVQALRIADDSFGFHPLLRSRRQKLGQRILSFRGEVPRLVAWYSR